MIVVVVDGNSSDSNHSYKNGIVVQPNLMPASLYTPSSSPPTLPRPQASQARVDASHVLYAKRYMDRTISHSLHLCHHLCSIHSLCNRQCQPLLQFLSTLGAVGGLRIQRRMRGRCGAVGGLRIFRWGGLRRSCLLGWKRRVGGRLRGKSQGIETGSGAPLLLPRNWS